MRLYVYLHLFKDEEDYKEFKQRHDKEVVRREDLASYEGAAYLGIDAGSTTFKAALISGGWLFVVEQLYE